MPILIQLVPKSHKKEVEMKFQMGQRDYATLARDITQFSNEARVREQQRGQADMDVDPLGEDQNGGNWTEEE